MLDERTYPDKRVIKFAEQVVPVKINSDKDEKTPERYDVYGQPTLLFLDPNGKVLGRFVGYQSPEDFVKNATKILKKRKSSSQ